MPSPFTERIIKPSDCTLGFGIPTSEPEFIRAAQNPSADFSRRFLGGYAHYEAALLRDMQSVLPLLQHWGVSMIRGLTLEHLAGAFETSQVVTIFTHWSQDRIEFSDGVHSIEEVVANIPISFGGLVDLCVCHPSRLADELAAKRPRCLVRYVPVQATPSYWLYFYRTIYAVLRRENLTYMACLEEVITAFRSTRDT
jgi:hypothetical protein